MKTTSRAWMKMREEIHRDALFSDSKHNGYAFGLFWSAYLAETLGYEEVYSVEAGVAGGSGLRAMDAAVAKIQPVFETKLTVIGLDSGVGMPPPQSYRDLPYTWRQGQYTMGPPEDLSRLLRHSELVLGPIETTATEVKSRIEESRSAVLGFASLDVDYYSSTVAALKLVGSGPVAEHILPRTLLYFDDISSTDFRWSCQDVGQLLAIREFNESEGRRKIRPIHLLSDRRPMSALWPKLMYACHQFDDPRYSVYVDPEQDKQRPLA